MNWYYKDGNKQIGPVADEAMKVLIRTGVLSPNTPVWREGLPEWTTIAQGELSGEQRAFTRPTPTPSLKVPPLLKRRIFSTAINVACILFFAAAYSILIQKIDARYAWHFHIVAGGIMFSVFWFVLNATTGFSPGRWLMGVKIERQGVVMRSFGRLLVRWLVAYLPVLMFIYTAFRLILDLTVYSHLGAEFHLRASGLLWGIVVPIVLWLAPLCFTRGVKGFQDLLSGCTATLSPTASTSPARHIAAICVIVGAILIQIIDLNVGLFSKWYYAPDGRFSLWIPSIPSISEKSVETDSFIRILGKPIRFRIEYVDYPQPIEDHFDYSSFIKDNFSENAISSFSDSHQSDGRIFVDGSYTKALSGFYFCENYRLWAVGSRLYILRVNGNFEDVNRASLAFDLFFDSFRAR